MKTRVFITLLSLVLLTTAFSCSSKTSSTSSSPPVVINKDVYSNADALGLMPDKLDSIQTSQGRFVEIEIVKDEIKPSEAYRTSLCGLNVESTPIKTGNFKSGAGGWAARQSSTGGSYPTLLVILVMNNENDAELVLEDTIEVFENINKSEGGQEYKIDSLKGFHGTCFKTNIGELYFLVRGNVVLSMNTLEEIADEVAGKVAAKLK